MFDADQIIFEAAWSALPECRLCKRRQILLALQQKIRRDHPAQKNVSAQLAMLDGLDGLQKQLPFTNYGLKISDAPSRKDGAR